MTAMQTGGARLRALTVALVAALVLAACGGGGAEPAAEPTDAPVGGVEQTDGGEAASEVGQAGELTPVRFAFAGQSVSPLAANFAIGLEMGYYEEAGIGPMEIIAVSDHAAVAAGLASGELQAGVGSPTFMLAQAAEGNDPPGLNFYNYTYPFKYDWAVPPGSEITEASQLAGTTVGVDELGRIAPIVASNLLEQVGIDPSEVEMIATGGGVTGGQALESGQVDVMLADDTMLGQWEVAGIDYETLPRPEEVPLVGSFYIQMTPEMIESQPELAVGLGRAVAMGSMFALENVECAAAIFVKHFPQSTPQGSSREEAIADIATIVGKRAPLWSPENIGEEQWGITIPELWEAEAEFQGVEGVDSEQLYTNELIEEINDFDAEAVRQQAQDCDPQAVLAS